MTFNESERLAVEVGSTTAFSYILGAKEVGGTLLDVSWTGVPNRNPSASGDFVAIWQNSGSVPWGSKADSTQEVTNKTPDGDLPFSGLSLSTLPYVVGYSVGADATNFYNIAAVVPIAVGGHAGTPQAITVSVAYVGATSLAIAYNTPIGVDPLKFGHTVVLVRGETFLPGSSTVIATAATTDDPNDAATFAGVKMVVGQYYTAAYLTGPAQSDVAATVTFLVQQA